MTEKPFFRSIFEAACRSGSSSSTTRMVASRDGTVSFLGARDRAAGCLSRLFGTRQQYLKRSALARCAHQTDCPTETPNDPLDDRKPEAVAREFGGEERVENPGLHFGCHAAPGVGDLQLQVIALGQAFRVRAASPGPLSPPRGHRITPSRSPIASDALVMRFITTCRICRGIGSHGRKILAQIGFQRPRVSTRTL